MLVRRMFAFSGITDWVLELDQTVGHAIMFAPLVVHGET